LSAAPTLRGLPAVIELSPHRYWLKRTDGEEEKTIRLDWGGPTDLTRTPRYHPDSFLAD